jgi:hypothetical protein
LFIFDGPSKMMDRGFTALIHFGLPCVVFCSENNNLLCIFVLMFSIQDIRNTTKISQPLYKIQNPLSPGFALCCKQMFLCIPLVSINLSMTSGEYIFGALFPF